MTSELPLTIVLLLFIDGGRDRKTVRPSIRGKSALPSCTQHHSLVRESIVLIASSRPRQASPGIRRLICIKALTIAVDFHGLMASSSVLSRLFQIHSPDPSVDKEFITCQIPCSLGDFLQSESHQHGHERWSAIENSAMPLKSLS